MYVEFEVILKNRVSEQPLPWIHEGGDCGACCLGGVLGRETAEVYKIVEHDPNNPMAVGSGPGLRSALAELERKGLVDRVITDVPYWSRPDAFAWFGNPGWGSFQAWFRYLVMALDAGYCAIAPVVHSQTGPPADPDHVVLIVGARFRWVQNPHVKDREAKMGMEEILVSDSSRTSPSEPEIWIQPKEFLMKRGGYNLHLVRPRKE